MEDAETLYRAVSARDRRFDGRFVVAVTSTGIYCRPSCPARTPRRENVRFFAVAAAAVAAGFRACRRCRPDTVPGSRDWDLRSDLARRALQLVGSGVVDDEGVAGLARRLAVSERHLHRTLVSELGVGPLGLARTRRAQTARLLLEQTDLAVTDVAFAAGFASIRQFNDVVREEFAATPSQLRARGPVADRPAEGGPLLLRLPTRLPWDPAATMAFLAARAIPGLERSGDDGGYARVLSTRSGPALVSAWAEGGRLVVRLQLPELELLPTVVASVRRLFDLDADAAAVDEVLGRDAALAPLVAARPGVRVPGAVDGFELAVRAVVGQQVSVAGARTMLGRVVARLGRPLAAPAPTGAGGGAAEDLPPVLEGDGLAYEFPTPASLADGDLDGVGLTGLRAATLRSLARAVVAGELDLRPGAELAAQRRALRSLPGVGPWTTEYVAMRALGDTDAFPADDLVLRREVERLGADPQRWRPWRGYAAMQLWRASGEQPLSNRPAADRTPMSGVSTRRLTSDSNSKES